MGAVLKFKLRRDRSEEIAHTLFRHINDGIGVDFDEVVGRLIADLDERGASVAEINAGLALAFRVLRVFERQLLDRLRSDDGGAA